MLPSIHRPSGQGRVEPQGGPRGIRSLSDVSDWMTEPKSDALAQLLRENPTAAIKAMDAEGSSPIHWCARHGLRDVMNLLLRRGADPNLVNRLSFTPLHLAAINNAKRCVEALLKYGADAGIASADGYTAYDFAQQNGHSQIVVLLNHAEGAALDASVSSSAASIRASEPTANTTPRLQPTVPPTVVAGPGRSELSPSVSVSSQQQHHHSKGSSEIHDLIGELMHQNHVLDQQLSVRRQRQQLFCGACDEEPRQRAVYVCEECRLAGDPYQLCTTCWADEHRSRRTRHHRRAPVPVVGGPGEEEEDSSSVDARAVLMIQQQMLQLLQNLSPRPCSSTYAQTDDSASQTGMTYPPPTTSPDHLAREVETLRHSLRASQTEAHVNYIMLAESDERLAVVLEEQSAVSDLILTATDLLALMAISQYTTDGEPIETGEEEAEEENVPPVEMVLGEKHLPNQPRMLLVRWVGSDEEEWVAEDQLYPSPVVAQYLRRHSFRDTLSRPGTDTFGEHKRRDGGQSPLGESERTELARQLAQLKRVGTAPTSRDSVRPGTSGNDLLPEGSGNMVVTRIESVSPDMDVIPPPPAKELVPHDLQASPVAGMEDTDGGSPSERIRILEQRHREIKEKRRQHEEELRLLREKQLLRDEAQRSRVHREYEQNERLLEEEQPHLNHPLNSTNDRHAALLLHKLHEEIENAERERELYNDFKNYNSKRKTEQPSPPRPRDPKVEAREAIDGASPEPGEQSPNRQVHVSQSPSGELPARQSSVEVGVVAPPALTKPAARDIETPKPPNPSKRLLYEQYFYQHEKESRVASTKPSKPPLAEH